MSEHTFVHARPLGGGVVELVLDRPDAMNAVSTKMAQDISAAAAAAVSEHDARCVVLSSSRTKAFCVGADLKERNRLTDDELRWQRPTARAAYRSILDINVPTVAAVEGYAMGGGFELALSCDLIVAANSAVFALPEVSVGVIPGGGGTQLLLRRVGWNRAADVIFTARRVAADEAHTMGMIDRVTEPGEARTAALEMAGTIAGHSPVGLREAKRAMRQGAHLDLGAGLDIEDGAWRTVAFSGDRAEGVAAFAEKRKPNWPGR